MIREGGAGSREQRREGSSRSACRLLMSAIIVHISVSQLQGCSVPRDAAPIGPWSSRSGSESERGRERSGEANGAPDEAHDFPP
ncbi:hypothetical protein BDW74DRAFT_162223 [Aspergillus multicolor]|uniref:uncharacterized protein n=1 Tax=Aspergillus multicolor TaxID=41759 RepID=UPI003CCDBE1F